MPGARLADRANAEDVSTQDIVAAAAAGEAPLPLDPTPMADVTIELASTLENALETPQHVPSIQLFLPPPRPDGIPPEAEAA